MQELSDTQTAALAGVTRQARTQREMLDVIRRRAVEAFGDDHAGSWLRRPSRYFDGRAPLEMAGSDDDCEKVLQFVGYFTAADMPRDDRGHH